MRYESGASRGLAAADAHAAFALGYTGEQPGYDSWRDFMQFG